MYDHSKGYGGGGMCGGLYNEHTNKSKDGLDGGMFSYLLLSIDLSQALSAPRWRNLKTSLSL